MGHCRLLNCPQGNRGRASQGVNMEKTGSLWSIFLSRQVHGYAPACHSKTTQSIVHIAQGLQMQSRHFNCCVAVRSIELGDLALRLGVKGSGRRIMRGKADRMRLRIWMHDGGTLLHSSKVVLAQELREVVQQHQQHAQRALRTCIAPAQQLDMSGFCARTGYGLRYLQDLLVVRTVTCCSSWAAT